MYQRKRASVSAAERSLANKAAGRIGRLAALFHLLWCLAERAEGPISLGDGQGAAKPWQGVEKSLVDCFRHRRRLGMEPVLEALKDAINQRRLNVDELWQQAQAQRMKRVMAPYLEALL
jgi:hypothetical protein